MFRMLSDSLFLQIVLITFVAISAMLGVDIHLASLPEIATYMGTTKQIVQQSVSIYFGGLGVSLLFYGPLSDYLGRKPVILIGLLIGMLSSYAASMTTHIVPFLVMRLIQGIGAGASMGICRVMMADLVQGERLAVIGSYLTMALSFSLMWAPALGGYIQHHYGWQMNFIVLSGFLGFILCAFVLLAKESNRYIQKGNWSLSNLFKSYLCFLKNMTFLSYACISGMMFGVAAVFATLSPFILQNQFHLTPIVYGWVMLVISIGSLMGRFLNPMLLHRFQINKTVLIGFFILTIAGLSLLGMMLWVPHIWRFLVLGVFIARASQAFTGPNIMSKALSPFHDKRGLAGSLYGCIQMSLAFLMSASAGLMSFEGVWVLVFAYLMIPLGCFYLFYYCLLREQ